MKAHFLHISDFFETTFKVRKLFLKTVVLLLSLSLLFSALPFYAAAAFSLPFSADDNEIFTRITDLRNEALESCGRRSFNGYCAWYVNLQLYLLNINREYVGGDGKDEFSNYCNSRYSNGGYRIHSYPADEYSLEEGLNKIISENNSSPVKNVLVGFSKAGGSGELYGHVFFIHMIKNGFVYFSDSFSVTVGGKQYPEGKPIKCTVKELTRFYGAGSFVMNGIIWFENEGERPEDTIPFTEGETGLHRVVAEGGLRVRSGPGTGFDKLALIPDGTELLVTAVNNDKSWGKVVYDGFEGWSSLEYMEKLRPLAAAVVDFYQDRTHMATAEFDSVFDAVEQAKKHIGVTDAGRREAVILITSDGVDLTGITVPVGIELRCEVQSVNGTPELSGGIINSNTEILSLEKDPFVSVERTGNVNTYSLGLTVEMRSASLVLNDNVCLRLTASASGILSDSEKISYFFICRDENGNTFEYPMSKKDENGNLEFFTGGIPAKMLADKIYGKVAARIESDGTVYEEASNEMPYSVTKYAENIFKRQDVDEKLKNLLSAMLFYGSAAQDYFNYNTEAPAILALPEERRVPPNYSDDELFLRAEAAPTVRYNSNAHITSANLELVDTVAVRMKASGCLDGASYSMLVWSKNEADELIKTGGNSDIGDLLIPENCKKTVTPDQNGLFIISGIPAKKLADTYYFRLCEQLPDGSVRLDRIVSYSVTTYCANKLSGEQSENEDAAKLARLCRALAVYSAAARDYFGN